MIAHEDNLHPLLIVYILPALAGIGQLMQLPLLVSASLRDSHRMAPWAIAARQLGPLYTVSQQLKAPNFLQGKTPGERRTGQTGAREAPR